MSVVGPKWARLALHGLVVVVGFLILSGSANTAIVGCNGVLSRVAEDGVLPEWVLKPHPTHGTTYRLLNLIVGLQLFTIVVSHGDVILLGEAYAFGVIWSFVFMALAMLFLRFKRPGERPFMVPGNLKVDEVNWPIGIALIFLVLLAAASVNLLSKPVATISGGIFSATLFATLMGSQAYLKKHGEEPKEGAPRLEEFNVEKAESFSADALKLEKPDRTLVGVRSNRSLDMLKQYLAEVDPAKTDVVVVAADDASPRRASAPMPGLSHADQILLSEVVKIAEEVGKPVHPLVVPTDDPFHALTRIARSIGARELILGASKRMKTKSQLDRVEKAWDAQADGRPQPLTVRVSGARSRDDRRELGAAGRP